MGTLEGRVALVTGGARRLGRFVAAALAGQGAAVVIHYNGSRGQAAEVVRELRAGGSGAWAVQADFADPAAAASMWRAALQACGRPIDLLVNGASIFPAEALDQITVPSVERNVRVNALAPFQLCRLFAAQGQEGAIVNFLDARVQDYDRGHVSYHLSKRMLLSLTRMMAVEYAPKVRVNAVAPGIVLPPEEMRPEEVDRLSGTNLLGRWGSPEDVCAAVLFLLASPFITGQVLYVDGGRSLKGNFYGG